MKSIVITGASSGIGRATALRLAQKGWRVFAAVRKDSDAQAVRAEAQGALETTLLDVTDRESIGQAARDVRDRLGGRPHHAPFRRGAGELEGGLRFDERGAEAGAAAAGNRCV